MSLTPGHLPVNGNAALRQAIQAHETSIDALNSDVDTRPEHL